jgi:hypothetical protein
MLYDSVVLGALLIESVLNIPTLSVPVDIGDISQPLPTNFLTFWSSTALSRPSFLRPSRPGFRALVTSLLSRSLSSFAAFLRASASSRRFPRSSAAALRRSASRVSLSYGSILRCRRRFSARCGGDAPPSEPSMRARRSGWGSSVAGGTVATAASLAAIGADGGAGSASARLLRRARSFFSLALWMRRAFIF